MIRSLFYDSVHIWCGFVEWELVLVDFSSVFAFCSEREGLEMGQLFAYELHAFYEIGDTQWDLREVVSEEFVNSYIIVKDKIGGFAESSHIFSD